MNGVETFGQKPDFETIGQLRINEKFHGATTQHSTGERDFTAASQCARANADPINRPESSGLPKVMAAPPPGSGSMRAHVFQASERDQLFALPSSLISVCGCCVCRRGDRPPESVYPPTCRLR